MLKTKTGRLVKYYGTMHCLPNGVSWRCVETKDDFIEFYVTDDPEYNLKSIEELLDPIAVVKRDYKKSSYEQEADILREFWNDPKLSIKSQQTIQDYYNDWYKYESFYQPLP